MRRRRNQYASAVDQWERSGTEPGFHSRAISAATVAAAAVTEQQPAARGAGYSFIMHMANAALNIIMERGGDAAR